jgi:hypothetical protein
MTGLEYVLTATFAAVWLVPATLALRWERRLRAATGPTVTGRE